MQYMQQPHNLINKLRCCRGGRGECCGCVKYAWDAVHTLSRILATAEQKHMAYCRISRILQDPRDKVQTFSFGQTIVMDRGGWGWCEEWGARGKRSIPCTSSHWVRNALLDAAGKKQLAQHIENEDTRTAPNQVNRAVQNCPCYLNKHPNRCLGAWNGQDPIYF